MSYHPLKAAATKCKCCGASMSFAERVNIAFGWEYIEPCLNRQGEVIQGINQKSRSAKICRECARKIVLQIGIEIPEECK